MPSYPNATMGTPSPSRSQTKPPRRERCRGATPARSGEPDLNFPLTPKRREHCQARDHASNEEATPTSIAMVSVQSRFACFSPRQETVLEKTIDEVMNVIGYTTTTIESIMSARDKGNIGLHYCSQLSNSSESRTMIGGRHPGVT
jgi:hypothetical protein